MNQLIGTIKLSGNEALRFANALFRPTCEEMKHHKNCLDGIYNNIQLRKMDDGFEADVEDLDLSFLNEISTEVQMDIETTIEMQTAPAVFFSNDAEDTAVISVTVKADKGFYGMGDGTYFDMINVAA